MNVVSFRTDGTVQYVHDGGLTDGMDGERTKFRASVIEPVSLPLRLAFRLIRLLVRDDSRLANWTRSWECLWRVRIIGGPVLDGQFAPRRAALEAEIAWQ